MMLQFRGFVLPRPQARTGPSPGQLVARHRRLVLLGAVLALLLVGLLGTRVAVAPTESLAPAEPAAAPVRLTARGEVRPTRQARIGTVAGGVVASIAVREGQDVDGNAEIARVRGPEGVDVLVAPHAATITGIQVHVGDTIIPGAIVATVGDVRQLQVETTDVDEFLIGHLQVGQSVKMTVEALDGRELSGRVRSIALEPRFNEAGDKHYPTSVDLLGAPAGLRPGMTVRLTFLQP